MNASCSLRCAMKMRTCGIFWHKAVVSLTIPLQQTANLSMQGRLTIARSKIFGGKIEISLGNNPRVCLVPVSGKDARRRQLTVRYGLCQSVTLRAPTSAVYERWLVAFETALSSPTFLVVPCVAAPIRLENIVLAPVHPARHKAKHTVKPQSMMEIEEEDDLEDDIPILEAGGPSSPTELDILASWRTWGSLDYFTDQPSISSSRMTDDNLELPVTSDCDIHDGSHSSRESSQISVDSKVSEFWLKPSDLQNEMLNIAANEVKPPLQPNETTPQEDDLWLEEIAGFMFHQKTKSTFASKQHPRRSVPGKLHSDEVRVRMKSSVTCLSFDIQNQFQHSHQHHHFHLKVQEQYRDIMRVKKCQDPRPSSTCRLQLMVHSSRDPVAKSTKPSCIPTYFTQKKHT